MNPPIRRLAAFAAILLLALLVNANWVQVVQSKALKDRPGNSRLILAEYSRQRGAITVAGSSIAYSVPTNDQLKYLRTYRNGPLYAPVTGFYSLTYGSTGIENAENSLLAGTSEKLFVRNLKSLLTGEQPKGGSVALTLNPRAQQAAYQALGGRRGAAVAIDPSTGAILALVSTPSYDPNLLSAHSSSKNQAAWTKLNADPAQPMLDRAISQTYPPGSTFKLVTSAAAIPDLGLTPASTVPGPASLQLPLTTHKLPNESGLACGPNNTTTLEHALAISCNTAYASIGLRLGAQRLADEAAKFGIGQKMSIPLPVAASHFPDHPDAPETALSAIGQYDVRVTPLQMAMVVASIANHGVLMKPYLVDSLRAPDTTVLERTSPQVMSTPMSPQTAAQIGQMMVAVVQNGTGPNGRIPGVTVAAKTGTAQTAPGRPPLAWFVSYAPADNPRVAVAVVIENGTSNTQISGNGLAGPVANAVMRAVLGK